MPWEYEVNGGGKQELGVIQSAESHEDFYGYDGEKSNHGYEKGYTTTLILHQNTVTKTYALIVGHHHQDSSNSGDYIGVKTLFSESVGGAGAYLFKDDPGDDYNARNMEQIINNQNTDGAVVDVGRFNSVQFRLDHTMTTDALDSTGVTISERIQDFRIIDGGSAVTAGRNGTITVYVPDGVDPINETDDIPTEGDTVVMVREDLAHF